MNATDLLNVFLAVSSVTVGAFLGALSNKLIVVSDKTWLHKILFWFAIGIALFSGVCLMVYWRTLTNPKIHWLPITLIVLSFLAGIALLWFTDKHLKANRVFTTKQLDPIVNKFTKNADKEEMTVCGGPKFFWQFSKGNEFEHAIYLLEK